VILEKLHYWLAGWLAENATEELNPINSISWRHIPLSKTIAFPCY
jgi:hypothetical protein